MNSFIEINFGKDIEILPEHKLPTQLIVLSRIRYLQNQTQLSKTEIVKKVSAEVITIWDKAAINHVREDHVVQKMTKILDKRSGLIKQWKRLQIEKEPLKSFVENAKKLFDISPADLYERLKSSRSPH